MTWKYENIIKSLAYKVKIVILCLPGHRNNKLVIYKSKCAFIFSYPYIRRSRIIDIILVILNTEDITIASKSLNRPLLTIFVATYVRWWMPLIAVITNNPLGFHAYLVVCWYIVQFQEISVFPNNLLVFHDYLVACWYTV